MDNTEKVWVSFCMSTYQRPELLEKSLISILNQTFKKFEIVISDNDPLGSAEHVIKKLNDSRIKYYKNGENLGMIKSFNKGIERAETEYVVMITDDDPIYPEMLQTLFDLYVQYPGYGVYHGGCDVICTTEMLAKVCNIKVGTNSCLSSEKSMGEITKYSADEFPHYFFNNKISNYMLWSIGVVKKDILIKIGGIPDYGTPYMGDLCFTVLTCSQAGVVVINSSLGCQVLHGKNFGYTEYNNYDTLYNTPNGFYNWISDRMNDRADWETLKPEIHKFIGRWMVGQCLVLKKYLTIQKLPGAEFNNARKKVFKISYLRKWKWKYYIAANLPILFKALLEWKSKYFSN